MNLTKQLSYHQSKKNLDNPVNHSGNNALNLRMCRILQKVIHDKIHQSDCQVVTNLHQIFLQQRYIFAIFFVSGESGINGFEARGQCFIIRQQGIFLVFYWSEVENTGLWLVERPGCRVAWCQYARFMCQHLVDFLQLHTTVHVTVSVAMVDVLKLHLRIKQCRFPAIRIFWRNFALLSLTSVY